MMKSFLSVAVRGSKVLTGRHVRPFASSGVRFNSTSTHSPTVSVSEGVSDAVKSTVTPAAVFDKAFIHTNGVEEAPVRSDKDRLVVFYDGGCPLCSREIAFYDRINRNSMSRIAFINLEKISPLDNSVGGVDGVEARDHVPHLQQLTKAYDINIPSAYRRLHALREDGSVHTSANAFCEIWQRLPYWSMLEVFVRNTPGVLPLAGMIYEFFAAKRIKWRLSLSPDIACSMGNK